MTFKIKIDSFTISRLALLIFIIIFGTYFLIENKKVEAKQENFEEKNNNVPVGGSTEKLSNSNSQEKSLPALPITKEYLNKNDTKELQKNVLSIYQELYRTNPTEPELNFYVNYVKQRNMTLAELREIIATSSNTLKKTFTIEKNNTDNLGELGTELVVIKIFNDILQRNPERDELFHFAKLMKTDTTLTSDKLKEILISTEEYQRLQKTQSNVAYTNLKGDITDRQITMIINKIYNNVTGKDYLDEDMMKFLKRKFVEFNLNQDLLKKFIKNYVDGTPFNLVDKSSNNSSVANTNSVSLINEENKKKLEQELRKKIQDELLKKQKLENSEKNQKEAKEFFNSINDPNAKNIYKDSKIYNFYGGEIPNKDIIENLKNNSTLADGSVDTELLNSNIKKSCQKNLNQSKQELADYLNDRNMSHLKNVCNRNHKFNKEDMVLDHSQSWSVPQKYPPVCIGGNNNYSPLNEQTALIGTLLTDAKQTNVGSVLPVYPPV